MRLMVHIQLGMHADIVAERNYEATLDVAHGLIPDGM